MNTMQTARETVAAQGWDFEYDTRTRAHFPDETAPFFVFQDEAGDPLGRVYTDDSETDLVVQKCDATGYPTGHSVRISDPAAIAVLLPAYLSR